MAGRYLITGVQLGLIKGYSEVGAHKEVNKIINNVAANQFIGNTNIPIKKDVQKYLIENIGINPGLHLKKVKNELS